MARLRLGKFFLSRVQLPARRLRQPPHFVGASSSTSGSRRFSPEPFLLLSLALLLCLYLLETNACQRRRGLFTRLLFLVESSSFSSTSSSAAAPNLTTATPDDVGVVPDQGKHPGG